MADFLSNLVWAGFFIWLVLQFKKPLAKLLDREIQVEHPIIGKWLLPRIANEGQLSNVERKEIEGLTGHDIWALHAFTTDSPQHRIIHQMSLPTKVMAKTFLEKGMIRRNGDRVDITDLGSKVLVAADNILGE